jgi:hypothetical protein
MILAFDGAADRDNAAKILKKKLQRSLPGG